MGIRSVQTKQHFFLGRQRSGQGCIERSYDGGCEFEMSDDHGGDVRLEREFGRQSGAEAPLPALDQIEPRMIARKAFGGTSERISVKLREGLAENGFLQQLAEFFVVI